MSNFRRGIYRPSADLVPVYLVEEDSEERSRAPLLVVLVLVVLSAFAGLVWLAYSRVVPDSQDVSLVITDPSAAVPAPALATAAARPTVIASRPTPAPAPALAPTAQAAKAASRAAAPAGTSRAVSGAAVLQLGAFASQELANGAWAGYRARFSVLGPLAHDVQQADVGKGTLYRLRAGPFANRAAAVETCTQLKAAGGNCFVAAP